LELFRQMLGSIADKMGIVLRKTAYSANIKERRDYSCAIYDRSGQTVAMGEHMRCTSWRQWRYPGMAVLARLK
jgi:N-methylhydantoinase B